MIAHLPSPTDFYLHCSMKQSYDGRVNGVMIDPATGFRLGGADPREMGYALGW
jgi:hypothetical protein